MKYLLLALAFFLAAPQAHATVYYVDFGTTTSGTGTSKDLAFRSLNEFANAARSAGDVAFVRRGRATTTGIVAASFTSDGTLNNPIVVSADYDNIWGAFASSTQTYEVAFGSTTMTASANQSDIEVGEWVYVGGDCYERGAAATTRNPCEFAYEVSAVSSTSISLHLPYKGTKTSTGNELRIMPKAPQIGTTAEAAQIFTMSGDDYWYFKGIDARSTNASCVASIGNARGTAFYDAIFQGNGVTDCGLAVNPQGVKGAYAKKLRVFGFINSFGSVNGLVAEDLLCDCNSVSNSNALNNSGTSGYFVINDGIFQNCVNEISATTVGGNNYVFRNIKRNNTYVTLSAGGVQSFYREDDFGVVGLSSQSSNQISSNTLSTTTMSTTTNLRAGGGPRNALVFPPSGTGNTGISTAQFPFSYIKLFEYPIYADTSSKTYTVYFNSTSTAQWTADPTTEASVGSSTPELFIECEYYGSTVDADRFLKRSNSANDVDFNGSTAWQDISVTCQPAQSGILYLRGWYGKPKEAGGNIFFMDTTPTVI